ncbi:MAG: imidazolonepropionase [Gammaproteobacteria bacterium]
MTEQPLDYLWTNATVATLDDTGGYGLINHGAVGVRGERIAWVGKAVSAPPARSSLDCGGALVTPGLIDCHTHLVYAGTRADEFERRLNGESYAAIARAGGGIASTVRSTRAASDDALYVQSAQRLDALLREGVTTVEIKSGYGLTTESECKMLRVARRLGERGVSVHTSFLGAHALPPEFKGDPDGYIDHVCSDMLPAVAAEGLADAVDAYCEGIGFSCDQVARLYDAATKHGLALRLHAEQLSDLGGASMAAGRGALSVDHLEFLSERDVPALAANDTTAVLLPGAFYCLRETQRPPVAALRAQGVRMALATDCNPGTSPVTSLLLMLSMGCTLFQLTPLEALLGVTRNAAAALGCAHDVGSIKVGKRADLVLWDVHSPAELSYRVGGNPCRAVMWKGQLR